MYTRNVYSLEAKHISRFLGHIDFGVGCWHWNGPLSGPRKYGRFTVGDKGCHLRIYAHRFAYEMWVGPIPEGLVIDHLCRVNRCVRPDHLEPVTNAENIRRGDHTNNPNRWKTHCPSGHEYSSENTRITNGRRYCRTCCRVKALARYHRLKEAHNGAA